MRLRTPREVANEALYLAVGFPIGLFWFCLFITLMSLSIGLIPIMIGLLVMVGTLNLAGICAGFERRLIADLLGRSIETPERCSLFDNNPNRANLRFLSPLTDGSYWRELLFLLLRFFLGLGSFVLLVLIVAMSIGAVVGAVNESLVPFGLGFQGGGPPTLLWLAAAVAAFAFGPTIIWAYAQFQGLIGHYLLGPSTATLSHRVTQAERRRNQSLSAAEAERQRIERDLHDGAQARLSTVALDLGRAKRKLQQGADADEVAAVIESAHADAKAAIVELRNLARGIHPAVLTDRGLDAALSEVISRSEIPITLSVNMARRPSATTESAAYFAVCELVTNLNRHSSARRGWITVSGQGDTLMIEVGDDGVGGVDVVLGTGVAGLHQRIESLGGFLSVDSPLGGGTTATIELPMTSGLAPTDGEPDNEHTQR